MNGPASLWFGSWPLEKKIEGEKNMDLFEKMSKLFVMVICFSLGLCLVIIGHYTTLNTLNIIFTHLGTAFFVVAIIGCSIELLLRKQLMKDVFNAAFGYVLPKELVPELQWLCKQTIICMDNKWNIELKYLDNDKDTIICHAKNTQLRENIGSQPEKQAPKLTIDDWFSPKENSKIIQLSYIHNSRNWPKNNNKEQVKLKENKCGLYIEADPFDLIKGDKLYVNYEYKEVKHCNDEHIIGLAYITKRSQVNIKKPDDIEVYISFAHREPAKKVGSDVYIIEDTLLPNQHIHIRWCQKDKMSQFESLIGNNIK